MEPRGSSEDTLRVHSIVELLIAQNQAGETCDTICIALVSIDGTTADPITIPQMPVTRPNLYPLELPWFCDASRSQSLLQTLTTLRVKTTVAVSIIAHPLAVSHGLAWNAHCYLSHTDSAHEFLNRNF
jgi:hypothetical protein